MKELINKFKKLDQTKRIVILFITISFVFIAGFSIYNGISGNYQKENTVQVTQTKEKKDKNTKKNKEEDKQENKEETNTQQEVNEQKEENTSQENPSKKEDSTKQEAQKKEDSTKKDKKKETSSKNTNQSTTTSSNIESNTKGELNSNNSTNSTNSTTSSNNSSNNNVSQNQSNNKITVNVQVIGMGDTMMSGTINVENGATGYSVLKQLADQNGIALSGSKIYVSGIGDLHEKQHGPMSGWMYSVNGVAPNKAACFYTLNDGDSVKWYYVNYN